MTLLKTNRRVDPADLLFKNFFSESAAFLPLIDTRLGHPIDVFEDQTGLHFEVAGSGLTKEDIKISIEGDTLNIRHESEKSDSIEGRKWFHKGISKKSFDFGYRLPASKYNISEAKARMENGLLRIDVPFSENVGTKTLTIE